MTSRSEFACRMDRVQSSLVRELLRHAKDSAIISLAGGLPASDLFDIDGLGEALAEVVRTNFKETLQYGLTEGDPELREQLVAVLAGRGITASVEQILITTGSQQAIDIAARVLLNPGDTVLVERPSYMAALQTFGLCEATVVCVPSDEGGMDVEWIERYASRHPVKAIYLVPNFGNPTGCQLSLARRQRMVALIERFGIYVIEDDPYGELRLSGEPIASIYALTQESPSRERVLYISSFSKIVSPGLRVGWMVMSGAIFKQAALAKQATDLHTCTLSQQLVTAYLRRGQLDARFRVLRAAYRERRDLLCAALREHLGGAITFNRPEGGMFLWGHFGPAVDTAVLLRTAIQHGVIFVPGANFYGQDPECNTLRLSYSTLVAATAEEGARRLSASLQASYPQERERLFAD